jgi:hypothetical protein
LAPRKDEFRYCARLLTYNTLPHLDAAQYADWITFA